MEALYIGDVNLKNYRILTLPILWYEKGQIGRHNKGHKCYLLAKEMADRYYDIIEFLSMKENLIIASKGSSQEYYENQLKRLLNSPVDCYNKLSLGYFESKDVLYNMEVVIEIKPDNEFFEFMFFMKLRQYQEKPSLLIEFIKHQFALHYKGRQKKYYQFLYNIYIDYSKYLERALNDELGLIIESEAVLKEKLITIDPSEGPKLNPLCSNKDTMSYFLQLSNDFNGKPILEMEYVKEFVNANFMGFEEGVTKRKIQISFAQDKVIEIFRRYLYDFAYKNIVEGEEMKDYATLQVECFTEHENKSIKSIQGNFSRPDPSKYPFGKDVKR